MDAELNFFSRIKNLCKLNDITLNELLDDCGITYQSYKSFQRYGNFPRADDALKIAKILNTTVEYLVTGETIAKPDNTESIQLLQQVIKNLS